LGKVTGKPFPSSDIPKSINSVRRGEGVPGGDGEAKMIGTGLAVIGGVAAGMALIKIRTREAPEHRGDGATNVL